MRDIAKKPPVVTSTKTASVRQPIDHDDDETRDFSESDQGDVDSSTTSSSANSTSPDIPLKFNKILIALVSIYDRWTTHSNDSSSDKSSNNGSNNGMSSSIKLDDCLSRIDKLNINDLSRIDLFAYLVELLDRLIELLFNWKRDHFAQLYGFLKSGNLVVLQFYDFINRILYPSGVETNSSKSVSGREAKTIVLGKAFELLHVLITSNI